MGTASVNTQRARTDGPPTDPPMPSLEDVYRAIAARDTALARRERLLNERERALSEMQDSLEAIEDELNGRAARVAENEQFLAIARAEIETLSTHLASLQRERGAEERRFVEQHAEIEQQLVELASRQSDLERIEEFLAERDRHLCAARDQLLSFLDRLDSLRAELSWDEPDDRAEPALAAHSDDSSAADRTAMIPPSLA